MKQVNVEIQDHLQERLVLTCREEQMHPPVIPMHVSPSAAVCALIVD